MGGIKPLLIKELLPGCSNGLSLPAPSLTFYHEFSHACLNFAFPMFLNLFSTPSCPTAALGSSVFNFFITDLFLVYFHT